MRRFAFLVQMKLIEEGAVSAMEASGWVWKDIWQNFVYLSLSICMFKHKKKLFGPILDFFTLFMPITFTNVLI